MHRDCFTEEGGGREGFAPLAEGGVSEEAESSSILLPGSLSDKDSVALWRRAWEEDAVVLDGEVGSDSEGEGRDGDDAVGYESGDEEGFSTSSATVLLLLRSPPPPPPAPSELLDLLLLLSSSRTVMLVGTVPQCARGKSKPSSSVLLFLEVAPNLLFS